MTVEMHRRIEVGHRPAERSGDTWAHHLFRQQPCVAHHHHAGAARGDEGGRDVVDVATGVIGHAHSESHAVAIGSACVVHRGHVEVEDRRRVRVVGDGDDRCEHDLPNARLQLRDDEPGDRRFGLRDRHPRRSEQRSEHASEPASKSTFTAGAVVVKL